MIISKGPSDVASTSTIEPGLGSGRSKPCSLYNIPCMIHALSHPLFSLRDLPFPTRRVRTWDTQAPCADHGLKRIIHASRTPPNEPESNVTKTKTPRHEPRKYPFITGLLKFHSAGSECPEPARFSLAVSAMTWSPPPSLLRTRAAPHKESCPATRKRHRVSSPTPSNKNNLSCANNNRATAILRQDSCRPSPTFVGQIPAKLRLGHPLFSPRGEHPVPKSSLNLSALALTAITRQILTRITSRYARLTTPQIYLLIERSVHHLWCQCSQRSSSPVSHYWE